MLDMSLLKSPSFMLLAVSGFLCMMGFFVPFLYLKDRDMKAGFESASADWLVSSIGIANTIARILCGFLSSLENVDANLLSNIAITLGGLATFASGYMINSFTQFSYTIVFGLAIGKSILCDELDFDFDFEFNLISQNFSLLLSLTFDYCR